MPADASGRSSAPTWCSAATCSRRSARRTSSRSTSSPTPRSARARSPAPEVPSIEHAPPATANAREAIVLRFGVRHLERVAHLVVYWRPGGATRASFAPAENPHRIVLHPEESDERELIELTRHRGRRLEVTGGGEYTDFGAAPNPNGDRCPDHWYRVWGEPCGAARLRPIIRGASRGASDSRRPGGWGVP